MPQSRKLKHERCPAIGLRGHYVAEWLVATLLSSQVATCPS